MAVAGIIILVVLQYVVNGCPTITTINGTCCDLPGFTFTEKLQVKTGIYSITNFCGNCGHVAKGYCDTTTAGGGWLVIQRRDKKYSASFHKGWVEYVKGFGDLNKEFWYGLEAMHCLTNRENFELRIDFIFANKTKSYMHYNHFRVGPAADNYRLNISGFTGITPTDPFYAFPINGREFTTYDRDNDLWSGNCALDGHGKETGGWWFSRCTYINPNYRYDHKRSWGFIRLGNKWYDPVFFEMKVRPSKCSYN